MRKKTRNFQNLSQPVNEAVIQLKILKYLNNLSDCWAVKVISANQRGVPDILGCCRGRFIAIEVKSADNKPSKIQQSQLNAIKQTGGIAEVVTSLEQMQKLIKELGDGPQE